MHIKVYLAFELLEQVVISGFRGASQVFAGVLCNNSNVCRILHRLALLPHKNRMHFTVANPVWSFHVPNDHV